MKQRTASPIKAPWKYLPPVAVRAVVVVTLPLYFILGVVQAVPMAFKDWLSLLRDIRPHE